jgi:hypothetical protein
MRRPLSVTVRAGGHAGFLELRAACDEDLDAYWKECRMVEFPAAPAFSNRW